MASKSVAKKQAGSGVRALSAKSKMQVAADKAIATGKMANTLAKALGSGGEGGWKFVDFTSKDRKRESAGIVDLLALRKSSREPAVDGLKPLDLFDVIVIQSKGGKSPRPTPDDIERLRKVADFYHAEKVVLFEWEKGVKAAYSVLDEDDNWIRKSARQVFPPRGKQKQVFPKSKPMSERDIALWENDVSNLMGDPAFVAKVNQGTYEWFVREGWSPEQAYPMPQDEAKREKYREWLRANGKGVPK